MERTEVLDMMGTLKLFGMKDAYDEALATAIKRKHEPQRLVGDLLKAIGYEYSTTKDGAEALKWYETAMGSDRPFKAVIMDLTVPGGMGGKEAIKKLLAIDPDARVIVASGYSNDPVMADFRAYGFAGVLEKPFDLEKLRGALAAVLSRPGGRRLPDKTKPPLSELRSPSDTQGSR